MQIETMAAKCSDLLDELLTAQTIIPGEPLDADGYGPFDYYLHCISAIPNNEKLDDGQLWSYYLSPAVQSIANALKDKDMLSAEKISLNSHTDLIYEAVARMVGGVPVKVIIEPGLTRALVTVEVKVRHTGNVFRRIINGPLHREMMPFKNAPAWDGYEFEYLYIPTKRKDYRTVEGDWDSAQLPGLNPDATDDTSIHRYKVVGDYCYYLGEELQR
jgi:hypothetical protein